MTMSSSSSRRRGGASHRRNANDSFSRRCSDDDNNNSNDNDDATEGNNGGSNAKNNGIVATEQWKQLKKAVQEVYGDDDNDGGDHVDKKSTQHTQVSSSSARKRKQGDHVGHTEKQVNVRKKKKKNNEGSAKSSSAAKSLIKNEQDWIYDTCVVINDDNDNADGDVLEKHATTISSIGCGDNNIMASMSTLSEAIAAEIEVQQKQQQWEEKEEGNVKSNDNSDGATKKHHKSGKLPSMRGILKNVPKNARIAEEGSSLLSAAAVKNKAKNDDAMVKTGGSNMHSVDPHRHGGHRSSSSTDNTLLDKNAKNNDPHNILPPKSVADACNAILCAIARSSKHGGGGGIGQNAVSSLLQHEMEQQQNSSITVTAAAAQFPSERDMSLRMDFILSRLPYRDMLRDLFSDASNVAPSIPIVEKQYEESYMREPIGGNERQCTMGPLCECNMISRERGFVGVEFLLPGERQAEARQMCVLCHRKTVQTLFHDIVYCGSPYRGVIQKYGNICGQPNEYAKEVALLCPPGGPVENMPYPSVSHQRNRYSIVERNGIRYIKQRNMSHQDFQ